MQGTTETRKIITKINTILIGDSRAGKTSIMNRFSNDTFNQDQPITIGIDFISRAIECHGQRLRTLIFDSAGEARFRPLIPSYLKSVHCVLIVFDITNRASFDTVDTWMDMVRNTIQPRTLLFLIGNKLDCQYQRKVTTEEALLKSKFFGLIYMEICAKTGTSVKKLFQSICYIISKREPIENIRKN